VDPYAASFDLISKESGRVPIKPVNKGCGGSSSKRLETSVSIIVSANLHWLGF